MIRYLLLGQKDGIVLTREPFPVGDGVHIAVPVGATLFWNGTAYPEERGEVFVPQGALRARNTVRILTSRGSHRCEGLGYDGTRLTPLRFDRDAVLLSIGASLADALETLDDIAAWILTEKQAKERSLFS